MVFTILLWLSVILYGLAILRRRQAWRQMPQTFLPDSPQPETFISVIIPIRNEARNLQNLLSGFREQHYPKNLFEVILVDDHSEDCSVEFILEFQQEADFAVKLISLPEAASGKKSALKAGILQASGPLLAFTDGDCRMQPNWLLLLEQTYRLQQAKFISGPVCLTGHSFFEKMQVVEFASLIGIGAASIGLKVPNMCNGANLAYDKAAFEAVNGFAGNEHIASGDDEFLMHKMAEKWPGKVCFLKAPDATVYTKAQPTLKAFLAQRIRWASKWKSYQNRPAQRLALLVFTVNLLLFLAIPAVLYGKISFTMFISAYLVKFATDGLFLVPVLRFLKQENLTVTIFWVQLFYVPYVVLTALAGLFGKYTWKGRRIRN
jgi:poly-beta-1,6-N-acetyl-D-glucosamine synthase